MQNYLTEKDIENLNKWAEEYDIIDLKINDKEKIFKLKELSIFYCKTKHIPAEIFKLTNLEILEIKHSNDLTELPKEIGNLTNLKKLSIGCGRLKKLPKEIGNLVNLKILEINSDDLTELPDEVYNLIKLKQLALTCNLKKISSNIKNLINLERLIISQIDNENSEFNVREIVAKFPNFPKLKNFYISKRYNYRIDNELVRDRYCLYDAKYLYIQDSDCLEEFPKNICDFTKLENLFINCYRIEKWGKEISHLTNLKRLHIVMHGLKEAPKWIYDLIKLEELTIDYPIEKLPKDIGKLINLKELNVDGAYLKKLPKEIGNLTKLKKLDISYGTYGDCDKLEELPKEIYNLINLEYIRMKSEKINKKILKVLFKAITDNNFNNIKKIEFGEYKDTGENLRAYGNKYPELCWMNITK